MKAIGLVVAITFALVAAGCGEKSSVTVYKKGEYQGKADTQPWAGDPFKGDKLAWERAVKARNNNQNEYLRATTN